MRASLIKLIGIYLDFIHIQVKTTGRFATGLLILTVLIAPERGALQLALADRVIICIVASKPCKQRAKAKVSGVSYQKSLLSVLKSPHSRHDRVRNCKFSVLSGH